LKKSDLKMSNIITIQGEQVVLPYVSEIKPVEFGLGWHWNFVVVHNFMGKTREVRICSSFSEEILDKAKDTQLDSNSSLKVYDYYFESSFANQLFIDIASNVITNQSISGSINNHFSYHPDCIDKLIEVFGSEENIEFEFVQSLEHANNMRDKLIEEWDKYLSTIKYIK